MGLASVLLVLSPFTQINTPYPSTAYLKGYLKAKGVRAGQADLGIETILALFSTQGLGELFAEIERRKGKYPAKVRGLLANKQRYIDTIAAVVAFLQGKNDPLAYRICNQDYLPESDRGSQNEEELEWAFGTSGLRDKARYLATLYLEDLCDLIRETIDPDFGFSRYAEHLGRCASSFDEIEEALQKPFSFIDRMTQPLLEKHIAESKPKAIAFSVPFPGNLFSTLRLAQWLRQAHPDIPILMGGGFVNTELRSITDTRFFKYIDYLLLDDGEDPLFQVLRYLDGAIQKEELVRTFSLDENGSRVVYQDNPAYPACRQSETGFPDYEGLPLDKYISVTICAAMELGKRRETSEASPQDAIRSSKDSYLLFRTQLCDLPYEELWIALTNPLNKVIQKIKISQGGVNQTSVDIRLVLKAAINVLASGIILCHNHPSGSLRPSTHDDALTERIQKAAKLMDIRILDHIILSDSGYYSYADEGRLIR